LVHLRTVPNAFHARVIAARLGADGIVTQLRGSLDGPYPLGSVSVWVGSDDLAVARELLLADEVEAVFADDVLDADDLEDGDLGPSGRMLLWGWSVRRIAAVAALVAMVFTVMLGRLGV
jgi:hypothetical protein